MQDKGQPLYTFDKGSCIKFENITVTVPSVAEPILHFKELILTPGEVVGVVGERGQGKSTLLKLLMKQIQPSSGSISLCNVRDQTGAAVERVDVTNCETRDWHTMVSKLYQDYPDMEGLTVAQAVHLGTQTHETADFQRLQDIVKLKGGILREDAPVDATVIGGAEGGVNFSGGQRQGIAVLRTLLLGLKKPIMLLDEPGASSDPKNEHEMLHRIKQLGRDLSNPKVMIIVSHQYGTLTDADKIIVINNHTIEKIDTHHNLLSQKGTYFSAWQRQIESLVPGASVDIDPDGQPIFTSKRRSSDE
jgi:ABC-type multidrug transport system fused ATPase/permease subunit